MSLGIKSVEALENYHLSLVFENGERGIFDMTPYLEFGIFKDLHDEALFRSVHVSFDTGEWGNGADMCPELLYENSVRSTENSLGVPKMTLSDYELIYSISDSVSVDSRLRGNDNELPSHSGVIPAKAGIHYAGSLKCNRLIHNHLSEK